MSALNFLNPPDLFIEIRANSWVVADNGATLEFPAETAKSRLAELVKKKGWAPRRRAIVAVSARGVSVRRMSLPPAGKEELPRLLRMQIESEFPLSPDELAWGWQTLGQENGKQQVLVAAVKKDLLQPVKDILESCGIAPVFTLAALANPPSQRDGAVLQAGARESELITFQGGAPASIRLLTWGRESLAPPPPNCLVIDKPDAIAGLRKRAAAGNGLPSLVFQTGDGKEPDGNINAWKWAAAAALLLLALLCFPYAEAVLLKPHLVNKLASLKSERGRIPAIAHELDFLQYLQRNQPPYLDTIYLISKVAPQGTSFDTLSMTRRGEFSIRGKFPNAQQVTEFRSNLISSAWFSTVVVEEQTPTPDRQVTVRMTAQVKPVDDRKPLMVETPKTPKS